MFTVFYYLSAILSFIGMVYYIYSESKKESKKESIELFANTWPTPREIFIFLLVTLLILALSSIPVSNTIFAILTFCYFVQNNETLRIWWNSPIIK